jgi:hypothetical protein
MEDAMKKLGNSCKAYMIDDLRKFGGWNESAREDEAQALTDEAKIEGETDLSNVLFVQENYTVTAGIFLDENVVLDKPTPEWIEFCRDTLKFDVPAIDPTAENSASPV